ncbi:MAG TPA: sigma-70 family RNA polymerase sigma factor [Acidimicrobiia bacterium]|nr:sigma-70 family RNA polymerase sigma factor [Acidimicrobiia bacterium]
MEGNLATSRDLGERLSKLLPAVREHRMRAEMLQVEFRSSADRLRQEIAVARRLRPRPARHLPVVVTPKRPGGFPLDAVRDELHRNYAATRDPTLRAQLMESYDGFARSLSRKFHHRDASDDLLQVARVGLLHAIDRFDPSLGRPFLLFARVTITGELKRHIRDKCWSVRVPRSLQEDYLEVVRAVDDLTAEKGASPSLEVVGDRCGLPLERVIEALDLQATQHPLSLDMPAGPGDEGPLLELGQEDLGFGRLENREMLGKLLARLPERDRRILELRFIGEMTQSQIAAEVGVSQMCVSRTLARTLGRLRQWARNAVG